MNHQHSYSPLFSQIDANTTIITPNRRLSASLHKHFHQYQIDNNKTVWETPDILPASSWINRLWRDHVNKQFKRAPTILNAIQEHFLWEQIVSNTKNGSYLLQVSETADMAKSAWALLKQWQINLNHPVFKSAEDYIALHQWASQFLAICHSKNVIDTASLPDRLSALIQSSDIYPPKHIFLIGFTEIAPQLKHLLANCETAGCTIQTVEPVKLTNESVQLSVPDLEQEIVTIARWAKATHEKNRLASIACVIPSLDKIRDRTVQIFSEVFAEDDTYTVNLQSCPFNTSAGKSLTHYPIINTALQLLGLYKKNISTQTFTYLLASPFLGEGESEHIKRSMFDKYLKKKNINQINLTQSIERHCPALAKRLQVFYQLVQTHPSTQSFSAWAALFSQLLIALDWPGERSISSDEYQTIEQWQNLLAELTTLDHIAEPINFHQALHVLHKMASKTPFQPKTPEAPIQLLGLLEAAGLPFDYLWVAGMDDISWPPQPNPNPFIPKSLQRELHMPHATAERELTFCQHITTQFKQCAASIVFSHAEKLEELELQASPLIRDLRKITLSDLNLNTYCPPSERVYQSRLTELIVDEVGPACSLESKTSGGVSVLQQQAICPFKAFSEWRLHAKPLEKLEPGLRAKDRGTLTHKAMEYIWNAIKNQSNLLTMEDDTLSQLITQSIEMAFQDAAIGHNHATQYLALEKQRLHKLIWDWLLLERDRPPFTVLANEEAVNITLNKMTLAIKIDRIDQLESGNKLIIDYKTGKQNEVSNWFSDRPEEPQLPLYSLINKENTIGITYAQIYTGNCLFKGISHINLDIPGIKPFSEMKMATVMTWGDQLKQWETILLKLSDAFYQGIAKVDPKDGEQTCTWCTLKPLCRINERAIS